MWQLPQLWEVTITKNLIYHIVQMFDKGKSSLHKCITIYKLFSEINFTIAIAWPSIIKYQPLVVVIVVSSKKNKES